METEIINAIKDLVAFTKDVSPEIWELLVKQQYIIAISWFCSLTITLLGIFIGFKIYTKEETYEGNLELELIGAIFMIACGSVGLFPLVGVFTDAIPRLLNPEYYALMALKP